MRHFPSTEANVNILFDLRTPFSLLPERTSFVSACCAKEARKCCGLHGDWLTAIISWRALPISIWTPVHWRQPLRRETLWLDNGLLVHHDRFFFVLFLVSFLATCVFVGVSPSFSTKLDQISPPGFINIKMPNSRMFSFLENIPALIVANVTIISILICYSQRKPMSSNSTDKSCSVSRSR